MKYYVISDNADTMVGLRLAGIPGCRVASREEKLAPMKLSAHTPLVVEIPDRHGSRNKDSITRYIREAIGVKV